jgi:hypothetical protein
VQKTTLFFFTVQKHLFFFGSSCAKESSLDTLLQETLLQKIFTNTLPQQLFWKISSSRTLFFRSYSSAIEIFTAALSSSPTLLQ